MSAIFAMIALDKKVKRYITADKVEKGEWKVWRDKNAMCWRIILEGVPVDKCPVLVPASLLTNMQRGQAEKMVEILKEHEL